MGLSSVRSLFFSVLIMAAGCSPVRGPVSGNVPGPGPFFFHGQPLALEEAVEVGLAHDYVLIGETHTNPCDHEFQAQFLDRLVLAGASPVVGLEMVGADRQEVLDRISTGEIALDDASSALEWADCWGFDFTLYRPIFEAAREHDLPLVGLNMPLGKSRKDRTERLFVPRTVILPPEAQMEELRDQYEAHKFFASNGTWAGENRFVEVQALRDTMMAETAVKARESFLNRPVVVLAGTGHVEHGWGIEHRLRILDPGRSVLRIMPTRMNGPAGRRLIDTGALLFFCPSRSESQLGFVLEGTDGLVRVVAVRPDSKAARAGFMPGDMILKVGDAEAKGLGVLHSQGVKAARAGKALDFDVLRGRTNHSLSIPLTIGRETTTGAGE
ncbi:MAG: PDZ domain-containing protein [Deltaproteobacteria bacterium]|nr:PDZ domain-containing protein [Deltaproteobacteria bacterium]